MKKLIVIGIIAMMITGLSVAAHAYAGTIMQIDAAFDGGNYQPILLGWYTDKGDGGPSADAWDSSDLTNGLVALPGMLRMNLGAVSGAPSEPISGSFMAPNIPAGELTQTTTKRWIITAQIESNPDHVGGAFTINAGFNPGFGPVDGIEFYIFAGTVSTTNCKAYAAAGTNYLAKLTNTDGSFSGGNFVLAAPTSSSYFDEELEIEMTVWGANPTTTFTVYAQGGEFDSVVVTPEPGSMLAMFSGLVGLVGFGIRRRK